MAEVQVKVSTVVPGAPATDTVTMYAKTDGKMYSKNDAGTEFLMSAPVTSGDVTGPSGAIIGNLASYDGTTGKIIKDAGVASSAVSTNSTHVAGNGSDHANVATNTTHTSGNGSDHANVATNTTHTSGNGSDHADVATNTTHRGLTSNPHTVTPTQVAGNNFVFAYDTATQAVSVANTFQGLNFSNNGQLAGWTHTSSSSVFACTQTGLYLVNVMLNLEKSGGGNQTAEMRATFNASEVAGSQMGRDVTANNSTMNLGTSFIVSATSGQNLVIQFTASATTVSVLPSPNPSTSSTAIGASLTITRIT